MLYNSLKYLIFLLFIYGLFACETPITLDQAEIQPEKSDLRLAFSVTEFSVGLNRIRFSIIDTNTGPIKAESVTVQTFYLEHGESEAPEDTRTAQYYEWPKPDTGIYGIETIFSKPGKWGIGVTVKNKSHTRLTSGHFTVKSKSVTPEIGKKIPTTDHTIIDSAHAVNQITSDPNPYMPFYQTKIADSIDSSKGTVIVFSSPAFCKTGTCGPQLEILKTLHPKFQKDLDFIHIEIYKNPHTLTGKIDESDINPVVSKWRLPSEPWTFITNRTGGLTHKFEGLVTTNELMDALAINYPH